MLKSYSLKIPTTSLLIMALSLLLVVTACTAAATTIEPVATPTPIPTRNPVPTQPPAPTQVSEPTQPSEAVPEASLEEAAKAEGGQLMIYTSMNTEDLEVVLAKFKETYPFVTLDSYRDSGQIVFQQVLTEAEAGQYHADVIEIDTINTFALAEKGLLGSFVAPESAAYPDQAKDADGQWTVDRINTVVIAYNTQLVKPADVPTTWEDLLDPKWQGKMVVEVSDAELLADMAAAWGEDKAYAFWEGIAAQKPTVMEGHTELAEALAAGEYAISPTVYAHRVERLKAKGLPIEWVKTDPVFAYTQIVALAAHAPHPATGKLFINWLLSESGQTMIRDLGRIPARAGISSDPPTLTEGVNIYYTVPLPSEEFAKFTEKWSSLFALK